MGETSLLVGQGRDDPAGIELPASLETGNARIDAEHRQLILLMGGVRQICRDSLTLPDCTTCSAGQQLVCEGRLIGLLGDLFACMLEHFASEELLMRDTQMQFGDGAHCAAHIEDHAAIAQQVQGVIGRLDIVHTVERIRELDRLLGGWVRHHVEMHDLQLARWLDKHGIPGIPGARGER